MSAMIVRVADERNESAAVRCAKKSYPIQRASSLSRGNLGHVARQGVVVMTLMSRRQNVETMRTGND